jgi:hypothetical protein
MKKTGSQYAIKASGGFQISNPTKTIHIQSIPNIAKYDITDSLQILFPANIINSLILNNTLVITPEIFLDNLNEKSFISFGIFENLYSKYESFINDNLGHMFSNSSLFSSNKKFDNNSFYDLFTSKTIVDNEFVNALKGNIKIMDVSNILQNIQKLNIFGNRSINENTDLFIPGDCFFMQNGISITLKTDLDVEPMFVSFIKSKDCANRIINDWDKKSTKSYCGNLFIYLV